MTRDSLEFPRTLGELRLLIRVCVLESCGTGRPLQIEIMPDDDDTASLSKPTKAEVHEHSTLKAEIHTFLYLFIVW
jgi:hypothetical protein